MRPAEAAPPRVASSSDDVRQTEATPDLVNPFNAGLCVRSKNAGTGAAYPSRPRRLELTKLAVELPGKNRSSPASARTPASCSVARPPARATGAGDSPGAAAGDCVTKRSRPVSPGCVSPPGRGARSAGLDGRRLVSGRYCDPPSGAASLLAPGLSVAESALRETSMQTPGLCGFGVRRALQYGCVDGLRWSHAATHPPSSSADRHGAGPSCCVKRGRRCWRERAVREARSAAVQDEEASQDLLARMPRVSLASGGTATLAEALHLLLSGTGYSCEYELGVDPLQSRGDVYCPSTAG